MTIKANGRPVNSIPMPESVRLGILVQGGLYFWLKEATIERASSPAPSIVDRPSAPPTSSFSSQNSEAPVTPSDSNLAGDDLRVGSPVQEVMLPAPADDVVVAASGTQLVLHLKQIQRLAGWQGAAATSGWDRDSSRNRAAQRGRSRVSPETRRRPKQRGRTSPTLSNVTPTASAATCLTGLGELGIVSGVLTSVLVGSRRS